MEVPTPGSNRLVLLKNAESVTEQAVRAACFFPVYARLLCLILLCCILVLMAAIQVLQLSHDPRYFHQRTA